MSENTQQKQRENRFAVEYFDYLVLNVIPASSKRITLEGIYYELSKPLSLSHEKIKEIYKDKVLRSLQKLIDLGCVVDDPTGTMKELREGGYMPLLKEMMGEDENEMESRFEVFNKTRKGMALDALLRSIFPERVSVVEKEGKMSATSHRSTYMVDFGFKKFRNGVPVKVPAWRSVETFTILERQ